MPAKTTWATKIDSESTATTATRRTASMSTEMDAFRAEMNMPGLSKCNKHQLLQLTARYLPQLSTTKLANMTNAELLEQLKPVQDAQYKAEIIKAKAARSSTTDSFSKTASPSKTTKRGSSHYNVNQMDASSELDELSQALDAIYETPTDVTSLLQQKLTKQTTICERDQVKIAMLNILQCLRSTSTSQSSTN